MNEEEVQKQKRQEDEAATKQRSYILGLRYFNLQPVEDHIPLYKDLLSIAEIRQNQVVPLSAGEGRAPFEFGITTRSPQSFLSKLVAEYGQAGKNIAFVLISETGFRNLLMRYDPPQEVHYDDIKIATEGDSATLKQVSDTLNSVRADQLFDFLVSQADKLNASDIHIENMRDGIRIRMRVDGALHSVAMLDKDRYRILIGELASRSGLSVAATKPQSGSIQMEIPAEANQHKIANLRVEMVPTLHGLDSVLRLFNFDESLLKLDKLGIDEETLANINEIISHPRGLVLVVGPTGSGKSTTLYSILGALNIPDRKIITLEDPIEYSMTGITQIPVLSTAGASFASGLRSILRLDPDIVMVGEIRDEDTAKTAIQASITGHLVLSTFHAESSAAALARMIDMIGVNPVFISAIRMIVSQRLVRKLDPESRVEYVPSPAERQWVIDQLKDVPDEIKNPYIENMKLYRPVLSEANPFGYRGRTSVMEQLIVDDAVKDLIRGDAREINTTTIESAAQKLGMNTMMEKAVLMALDGVTTIEEINRVL